MSLWIMFLFVIALARLRADPDPDPGPGPGPKYHHCIGQFHGQTLGMEVEFPSLKLIHPGSEVKIPRLLYRSTGMDADFGTYSVPLLQLAVDQDEDDMILKLISGPRLLTVDAQGESFRAIRRIIDSILSNADSESEPLLSSVITAFNEAMSSQMPHLSLSLYDEVSEELASQLLIQFKSTVSDDVYATASVQTNVALPLHTMGEPEFIRSRLLSQLDPENPKEKVIQNRIEEAFQLVDATIDALGVFETPSLSTDEVIHNVRQLLWVLHYHALVGANMEIKEHTTHNEHKNELGFVYKVNFRDIPRLYYPKSQQWLVRASKDGMLENVIHDVITSKRKVENPEIHKTLTNAIELEKRKARQECQERDPDSFELFEPESMTGMLRSQKYLAEAIKNEQHAEAEEYQEHLFEAIESASHLAILNFQKTLTKAIDATTRTVFSLPEQRRPESMEPGSKMVTRELQKILKETIFPFQKALSEMIELDNQVIILKSLLEDTMELIPGDYMKETEENMGSAYLCDEKGAIVHKSKLYSFLDRPLPFYMVRNSFMYVLGVRIDSFSKLGLNALQSPSRESIQAFLDPWVATLQLPASSPFLPAIRLFFDTAIQGLKHPEESWHPRLFHQ